MKLHFIDEPELEFGGGGRHIDIRHGLAEHGPLDRGLASDPVRADDPSDRHEILRAARSGRLSRSSR